jgi:hypothetical protein
MRSCSSSPTLHSAVSRINSGEKGAPAMKRRKGRADWMQGVALVKESCQGGRQEQACINNPRGGGCSLCQQAAQHPSNCNTLLLLSSPAVRRAHHIVPITILHRALHILGGQHGELVLPAVGHPNRLARISWFTLGHPQRSLTSPTSPAAKLAMTLCRQWRASSRGGRQQRGLTQRTARGPWSPPVAGAACS